MAQTANEIAKEIVIAWLNTQNNTEAKNEFSGKDPKEIGKFIGGVYNAVLETIRALINA